VVTKQLAGVEAAARLARSSVVRIGRDRRGLGMVIAGGLVLTSAHNLRGQEVTVTFPGGRRSTGAPKGVDADGDLAVLDVDTSGSTPAEWADVEVALGAEVFVPGLLDYPADQPRPRVTAGQVSAIGAAFRGPGGRLVTDAFEHTAPVPRGSSGGPVLDASGKVLGINTHRPGEGLYLALKAGAELRARVERLAKGESPARRRLGVALAPAHVARRLRAAVGLKPAEGMLVRDVAKGSPAEAAGILAGDLVVEAGGRPVASLDDLTAALDAVGEDGTLPVRVLRGTDELQLTVRF
jgi:serine protease Do